ncbi:hypothetical protein T439DRAFT_352646 [Meredithblackwellia eburnea MCA 4105]
MSDPIWNQKASFQSLEDFDLWARTALAVNSTTTKVELKDGFSSGYSLARKIAASFTPAEFQQCLLRGKFFTPTRVILLLAEIAKINYSTISDLCESMVDLVAASLSPSDRAVNFELFGVITGQLLEIAILRPNLKPVCSHPIRFPVAWAHNTLLHADELSEGISLV